MGLRKELGGGSVGMRPPEKKGRNMKLILKLEASNGERARDYGKKG